MILIIKKISTSIDFDSSSLLLCAFEHLLFLRSFTLIVLGQIGFLEFCYL